jgi:hypothetical protein
MENNFQTKEMEEAFNKVWSEAKHNNEYLVIIPELGKYSIYRFPKEVLEIAMKIYNYQKEYGLK